ncbi:MAG: hypothetical protein LC750_13415 [Actinobacteria bacterium]|nr:hypothetical protein [Actinomycetota bacterium]
MPATRENAQLFQTFDGNTHGVHLAALSLGNAGPAIAALVGLVFFALERLRLLIEDLHNVFLGLHALLTSL